MSKALSFPKSEGKYVLLIDEYDAAFSALLRWYDGYQFSPERMVEIINPVSLGVTVNANGDFAAETKDRPPGDAKVGG